MPLRDVFGKDLAAAASVPLFLVPAGIDDEKDEDDELEPCRSAPHALGSRSLHTTGNGATPAPAGAGVDALLMDIAGEDAAAEVVGAAGGGSGDTSATGISGGGSNGCSGSSSSSNNNINYDTIITTTSKYKSSNNGNPWRHCRGSNPAGGSARTRTTARTALRGPLRPGGGGARTPETLALRTAASARARPAVPRFALVRARGDAAYEAALQCGDVAQAAALWPRRTTTSITTWPLASISSAPRATLRKGDGTEDPCSRWCSSSGATPAVTKTAAAASRSRSSSGLPYHAYGGDAEALAAPRRRRRRPQSRCVGAH